MLSIFRNLFSYRKEIPKCIAPWTSMSFNIDGTVTACCLNRKTSVSIEGKTIKDVWESKEFQELRNKVRKNDLTYDCQICLEKINNNNIESLKANDYNKYTPISNYPKVMEFCLENTCNLACEMCNSILSSTIRKNKGLEPLKSYYGNDFVQQLNPFIPHLQEAIFAGGEPFLIPRYYNIWEKMISINPKIRISVVTNGTVLNKRIKELLERGNFNINISIDSSERNNYLAIRKNADFEKLIRNFNWFNEYAKKKKQYINIPICPMVLNWKTIPQTIKFANQHNATINFIHVDRPLHVALKYADKQLLKQIIAYYKSISFSNIEQCNSALNISKFNELIIDIEKWEKNAFNNKKIDWENKALKRFGKNNVDTIKIIGNVIQKKQEIEHNIIAKMVLQLSKDRFEHIFNNKPEKEINLLFEEYVG